MDWDERNRYISLDIFSHTEIYKHQLNYFTKNNYM